MKTLPTFKDLKFISRNTGGWSGFYIFENGYRLSVVCGEAMYCTPKINLPNPADYSAFEIAVLGPDNEWATKEFFPEHEDDVVGWQSLEEITDLMVKISEHSNS